MKSMLKAVMVCLAVMLAGVAFAGKGVENRTALNNINDLTIPSSTQGYPIGTIINVFDSDYAAIKTFQYIKAQDYLTANKIYVSTVSAMTGYEVGYSSPIGMPALTDYTIGVPLGSIPAGYYGFVQIAGDVTLYVTTNTTIGDTLRAISTANTLTDTSGVALSSTTCALAKESRYGVGTIKAYLLNRKVGLFGN